MYYLNHPTPHCGVHKRLHRSSTQQVYSIQATTIAASLRDEASYLSDGSPNHNINPAESRNLQRTTTTNSIHTHTHTHDTAVFRVHVQQDKFRLFKIENKFLNQSVIIPNSLPSCPACFLFFWNE